MRRETAETVLDFWLRDVGPKGWYTQDADRDAAIVHRFRPVWEQARTGALQHWEKTPPSALALLIVLDQFPRNMFRGDARAYATDPLALWTAYRAIAEGHDVATAEPERQFFYLPLMHSEILADQTHCCALISERLRNSETDNLSHAERHRDVIARFGRFPSRNAALGRSDTDAELSYRADGGYMG
ncbi:MAG: DUF924 family protein [Pseudomonadota bacterium]